MKRFISIGSNASLQWTQHLLKQTLSQGVTRNFSRTSILKRSFNLAEPTKVLVGTQTGTAMGFAQNFADAASLKGITNLEVLDLDEYEPSQLEKEKQVIFILACYGTGEPTDNAKRIYKYLMDNNKKLEGLHYAVFGLGSSKTHKQNYNIIGINVDKKLEEIGARRVFQLGLGDDSGCIEVDFQKWQDQFLEKLTKGDSKERDSETKKSSVDATATNTTTISGSDGTCPAEPVTVSFVQSNKKESQDRRDLMNTLKQGGFLKSNTVMFPVLTNKMINPNFVDSMLEMHLGSPKPINSSETTQPFSYETGDHIGIYPTNESDLVTKIANHFNYPLEDIIQFNSNNQNRKPPFPNGVTVREALTNCLEIQSMPKPVGISYLATYCRDLKQKAELESIAKNPEIYKERIWKENRHLIDIIEEFPSIQLPFFSLTQVVPPLQPRYYSISSSSLEYPQQVHVTYRWVHYYNSIVKVERQGVTTRYLKNLNPNESKSVFGFMRTSTFRQPIDSLTPVVMIAGGSGIAPLKAFLQERLYKAKTQSTKYGTGILLFGVRTPEDLVYSDLIQECLKHGALTDAHISYSSPTPPGYPSYTPRYVSHDIRDNTSSIWKAISDGGYVYMCGGASAFAHSCGKELRQVFQTGAKLDSQGADDYLLSLIRQKRYMEDLSD